MTRVQFTRRGTLALAGVAIAGCLGGADDATPDVPDGDWRDDDAFDEWMADTDTRFGEGMRATYRSGFHEVSPHLDFLELPAADVEGHLIQSGTEIHLGEFDADRLRSRVDGASDHEVVDEYEGYAIVDGDVAVGDDAVLWDVIEEDPRFWIDVRTGERDRLVDAEPAFTRLFEALPGGTHLSCQTHDPAVDGFDVDAVRVWGHVLRDVESLAGTWAFVLREDAEPAEDVLTELEAVADEVDESDVDGHVVTVTGMHPDLGAAFADGI